MMINSNYPTHEPVQRAVKGDTDPNTANTRPTRFVDLLNAVHREDNETQPTEVQLPVASENGEASDVAETEDTTVNAERPLPAEGTEGAEDGDAKETILADTPAVVAITPIPPPAAENINAPPTTDAPEEKKEAVPVTLPPPTRNPHGSLTMGKATISPEASGSYTPVPPANAVPGENTAVTPEAPTPPLVATRTAAISEGSAPSKAGPPSVPDVPQVASGVLPPSVPDVPQVASGVLPPSVPDVPQVVSGVLPSVGGSTGNEVGSHNTDVTPEAATPPLVASRSADASKNSEALTPAPPSATDDPKVASSSLPTASEATGDEVTATTKPELVASNTPVIAANTRAPDKTDVTAEDNVPVESTAPSSAVHAAEQQDPDGASTDGEYSDEARLPETILRQNNPAPSEHTTAESEIAVRTIPPPAASAAPQKNTPNETEEPHSTTTGESVDTDSTTTPRPPQLSEREFPRTLNALFAEHAVRARQTTASSVQRLVEELTEITDPAPTKHAVDEPTPSGAGPASPTAALESGGVRLSSGQSTPRIPLANLPGEIAQQIHRVQQEGSTTLHLRISPKNLGDLRLEVHREGDTVRVSMVSSNPQVREALESQLPDLRRALSQQGFNLSDASVDDGSTPRNGHGSFSRQSTEQGHRNNNGPQHSHSNPTETIRSALRESPRITSDSINVLA